MTLGDEGDGWHIEQSRSGRRIRKMMSVPVEVKVDAAGLAVGGSVIACKSPVDRWRELIGTPERIDEFQAPPAPYGHRNNQRHVYDRLGLYLGEHHATRLVEQIVLVLIREEAELSTEFLFSGKLLVDDQLIETSTAEHEVARQFDCSLPGSYSRQLGPCSVWLTFKGKRRTRKRSLVTAAVCF